MQGAACSGFHEHCDVRYGGPRIFVCESSGVRSGSDICDRRTARAIGERGVVREPRRIDVK